MTRSPLVREIALILLFKVLALAALYTCFFGPAHRFKPSPSQMVDHFSAAPPVTLSR